MDMKERMAEIKEKQRLLMTEYESVLKEFQALDLYHENEELKIELETLQSQFETMKEELEKAKQENTSLRIAINEQIIDEKLNILKVSKQKLDTYFRSKTANYHNRLHSIESETKDKINTLREHANKYLREDQDAIQKDIQTLSITLQEKIEARRLQLELEEKRLLDGLNGDIDELRNEPVSEEIIQRRMKQNEIEMKIGLNWVNKIGILLILLGVGAAAKYSYSTWFNNYMKGITFFLIGGVLLLGGEWAYRKAKGAFATGLLGGGVSVLYGATFYSYFLLHILSLTAGLLISIIVTLATIVLSLRYNSKTVISLGLIGGYFPFFSYVFAFGLNGDSYYIAMGYLFLLNLAVLLISVWKKWNITNYISFLLQLPSLVYLVFNAPNEVIGMAYTILTFFMYLGITLTYQLKYKMSLLAIDFVLLALNTFFSSIIIYGLFDKADLNDYQGALALVFALVFIGLGKLVEKLKQEKFTIILFYGTSLTFAILMVPFQFGMQWLSMGWLVEGMILILYAYQIKHRIIEGVGWGLYLTSVFLFFAHDAMFLSDKLITVQYFDVRYGIVTLSMLLVSYFYLKERIKDGKFTQSVALRNIRFFKYLSLLNVWAYLLYSGNKLYNHYVPIDFTYFNFYKFIFIAWITIGLSYLLSKITILLDRVVTYYRLFLYILGDFIMLTLVLFIRVLKPEFIDNTFINYLALAVLILFNIYVFFSLRDLVLKLIRLTYKNVEIYPVFVGIYLLGIITAFLVFQFDLGSENLLFSILYLFMAIGYILFGFIRRFIYIRRMGLVLSLLSTTKLFIFDLSFLHQGSRIFAYFIFGVILLVISFIYQKISSKMDEPNMEERNIAEKI